MAQSELKKYQLIVIGGSAGSLTSLIKIVVSLKQDLEASVIIIIHRKNDKESILADLLTSRTTLPVKEAEDKVSILPGTIYVAPADYHLLLEDRKNFALDGSEKIHFSRPSIDVTMESAAEVFGSGTLGILLSGANADGADGLLKIKRNGGYTMVQNPASAEVAFMPAQAIKLGAAEEILSVEGICARLTELLNVAAE